jgi:DNA-binding transcriptional regulator YhcF (GntR family)
MGAAKSHFAGPLSRRRGALLLPPIVLDRASARPLYEQLCAQLGEAVAHAGPPGARLPSTRLLARMLGVSRNTVVLAYEELISRGLIEARHGSGMTVVTPGTNTSGSFDARRLLREAQYPSRTLAVADPDGTALVLVY